MGGEAMGRMGKYCKAYPVQRLREFNGWIEKSSTPEEKSADGTEMLATRALTENDYLYLQENFSVTDGIFIDENVIFDEATPEWIEFCQRTLKFEVPEDKPAPVSLDGRL
jgi:hypothetical protein